MTLANIRTAVRYNLRETTPSVWTNVEIDAQINQAQRYVASQLDPKYLPQLIQTDTKTAASSTLNYDLDANYMRMVGNPDVGGTEYPLVSPEEGKRVKNFGSTHIFSGKAVSYISNNDIYFSTLSGMSGNTITWLFMDWPTDLSLDGDVCVIQDSVIDLVIDRASARAYIKTEPEKAIILLKNVDDRIKELNK